MLEKLEQVCPSQMSYKNTFEVYVLQAHVSDQINLPSPSSRLLFKEEKKERKKEESFISGVTNCSFRKDKSSRIIVTRDRNLQVYRKPRLTKLWLREKGWRG